MMECCLTNYGLKPKRSLNFRNASKTKEFRIFPVQDRNLECGGRLQKKKNYIKLLILYHNVVIKGELLKITIPA